MTARHTCIAAAALTALTAGAAEKEEADTASVFDTQLHEVVVTGTHAPRLLKDTPVQTTVISAEDIARADATDISELLPREIPGIEFSYAMNQQKHMNFGGFGGQSVLFLVDGERLAGETMDDVDFGRLGMTGVERVEIVRGASSAIYGSNAGGGVVNLITRAATRPWAVSAGARLGRHGEQRYNLLLQNRHKALGNTLSATFHDIRNYDVVSAPDPAARVFATVYGGRTLDVREQLTVDATDNLRLTARAGYYFRQLARTADNPERYRDYSAGLKGLWHISDKSQLELAYAFDQYDKSEYRRRTNLDIRNYSNVQNSLRALFVLTSANGHTLTAGADFVHDYLMNTRLDGDTRTQDNADAFLQYGLNAGERWEAVGALRYDYFSDGAMSRVTPRLSVRYRPVPRLNLRMSYGMGFRAPSLKERYYDFDMAGIWIVRGNPSLKPETAHNINISADYTRRNYNFTLTAYYNRITDRITTGLPYLEPGDEHQLYLNYVNLDGYSVAGVDAAVQARYKCGLSAKIAYSFNHERTARGKDGRPANNQYMPARPHSLTVRADWTHAFSKKYSLTACINGRVLSAVSNREYKDYYDIGAGTVSVSYPAYTIWRLSCTQTFYGRARLTLTVDNLFNYRPKYYYLNAPLTDGTNFLAGISIDLN